jgi:ribosomal protein S28E/S33
MKPITDILREIRKGRAVDQATRLLAEVVRAVDETGKPGELTIKLKVKPEKGGGSQKVIQAEIKAKKPEGDIPEAVFFSDPGGDLHRSDPQQSELFSEASKPSKPSGDVDKLGRGPIAAASAG